MRRVSVFHHAVLWLYVLFVLMLVFGVLLMLL